MARPRKRGRDAVKYTIRVIPETDQSLRILYGLDKSVRKINVGDGKVMTFNDYVEQVVFAKFIGDRRRDLDIFKELVPGIKNLSGIIFDKSGTQ